MLNLRPLQIELCVLTFTLREWRIAFIGSSNHEGSSEIPPPKKKLRLAWLEVYVLLSNDFRGGPLFWSSGDIMQAHAVSMHFCHFEYDVQALTPNSILNYMGRIQQQEVKS